MTSTKEHNLIIFGLDFKDELIIQDKAELEGYLSVDHMLYDYFQFPKIEMFDCMRRYHMAVTQHWLNIGVEFVSMETSQGNHNFIAVSGKKCFVKKNDVSTLETGFFEIDPTHILKLKKFCETLDIPFFSPNWYVVA